jgi:hypothetical protein
MVDSKLLFDTIGVESERCDRNTTIVHKDMQRQAHAQKVLGRVGTVVDVVQIQLQELDLWCSNIGILGFDLLFGLLDGLGRALLTATGGNNMGTMASEGYHSSIAEFGVNASDQGELRNEVRDLVVGVVGGGC